MARAFDVYQDGEKIDTVYYDGDMTERDVQRSLVNHDGYDSDIVVKKAGVARSNRPRGRAYEFQF